MSDTDRLRADAALIAVGSWITHREVRLGDDPFPKRLGIVCAVDRERTVDDDGDITDVVVYRYRNPDNRDPYNVGRVTGADIDPAASAWATPLEVSRLARRVCFEVGRSKTRSGIARELKPAERSAIRDVIAVLVAVLP